MNVKHEPDNNRFIVPLPEGEKALLSYQMIGDVMNIMHTEVPDSHESEGIASELVRYALDWARSAGKQVEATCKFARSWIERHEEYHDVLSTV